VDEFSVVLDRETGYDIDMGKVENLKNLAHVQGMGNMLSLCIIVIVLVFISVFIYFLLNTHFYKIQQNLGTFMAFGVSASMFIKVYLIGIYSLIFLSYMCASILSGICTIMFNYFMPIVDDKGIYPIFDCLVWHNILLLMLTLLCATITTLMVVKRVLNHTPGDLIYDRINS
jgi:hypothetical protein